MKKFIAMLLVGAVLFTGLVGCGGDTGGKKDDKKTPETKKDEKKKES